MITARHPPPRRLTLVEVIIIVGVFAVLAVMLLPLVDKIGHRTKPTRVYCAGHLKQLGLAMLMYSGDYAGYFPNVNPWGYGDANNPRAGNWQPLGARQYVADTASKVWQCPSSMVVRRDCSASSYLYYGSGLKDDNETATASVIGFDASGNHPDDQWMNALFIDGHAEGAKPDGTKGWNRNTRPPPPAPQDRQDASPRPNGRNEP